jgi:hypothetical protein
LPPASRAKGWFVILASGFTFGHLGLDHQRNRFFRMKRRNFLSGALAFLLLTLGWWTVNAQPKVVYLVNK